MYVDTKMSYVGHADYLYTLNPFTFLHRRSTDIIMTCILPWPIILQFLALDSLR